MLALLSALLILPTQLPRDGWTAHVLAKAPGQSSTRATGAGALHIAAYGNAPGSYAPNQSRALLLGAEGYLDVTPVGFTGAVINDSSGLQHVGGAGAMGNYPGSAWLWTELGASINLNPPNFSESEALGVGGGQQVGFVYHGGWCLECGLVMQRHATLWFGSANSMVQLHSSFANSTMATGTDGIQQVGQGAVGGGGYSHALLWKGPASTVIDLHPGPEYFISIANGVHDGEQAGSVSGVATGFWPHAALWTGTPTSFVDLNPPGCSMSTVCGVRDGMQVGWASPTGATWHDRAVAWQGTPESVIDLHSLLPAEFQTWNSSAEDIDAYGNIVGFVEVANVWNPVVWLRVQPLATSQALALGPAPIK